MNPKRCLQFLNDNSLVQICKQHYKNVLNTVDNETITNSKSEKLLEIKIEQNLSFNKHATSLCKKATQKVCTCIFKDYILKKNLTKEEISQNTVIELSFSASVPAVPKTATALTSDKSV